MIRAPLRPGTAERLALVAALLLPPLAALLLPPLAERSLLATAALWLEPLWASLALYLMLACAIERRGRLLLGLVVGAISGLALLHRPLPTAERPAKGKLPAWAAPLRACSTLAPPQTAPVRLLQYSRGSGPLGLALRDLQDSGADLFLLTGFDEAEALSLGSRVQGEARHFAAADPTRALSVVVRGAFHPCGAETDVWSRELPSTTERSAQVALSFPAVRGAGVTPLLALRLDGAGAPGDWSGWPRRQADGAAQVAELIGALGASNLVVAGELMAPRGRRALWSAWRLPGLTEAPLPNGWPGPEGAFAGLRLHAVDGLWVGADRALAASGRLGRSGPGRAPVWAELRPAKPAQ